MPKLIDYENKKREIAHAALNVILKEGMAGASVRTIAKEAGITLGALRYYFSTQEELLSYTEQFVHAALAERTSELFMADLPPLDKILKLLTGLMPMISEISSASEARLIFKLQYKYSKKTYDSSRDSIYQAIKSVMSNLVMLNLLKKDADLTMETDRLYALMDGLALDIMLGGTESKQEKTVKLLQQHIVSICKEGGRGQF